MKKKIFITIGIVLGGILSFVGGVLGVMALMGKFKTPTVSPNQIYFANNELVIVAGEPIYEFELRGVNNSKEFEGYKVNKTDCFITLKEDASKYIQICDKEGNLITPNASNYYPVNCNEKSYFKLREDYINLDEELTGSNFGSVKLAARTGDQNYSTSQDLTIWIDRNVESVFVTQPTYPTEKNEETDTWVQHINVSPNGTLEFDFDVNPTLSWRPISKENRKEIEVYYVSYQSIDYKKLTATSILENYFAEGLFTINTDTGNFVFNADKANVNEEYRFVIATYKNYAERDLFTNVVVENDPTPNYNRVQNMLRTELILKVLNTDVEGVAFGNNALNLPMYMDVTASVDSNSGVNGAIGLNITMEKGGQTYTGRLNEIDFNLTEKGISKYLKPHLTAQPVISGQINIIDFERISEINVNGNNLTLTGEFFTTETDVITGVGAALQFTYQSTITLGDYKVVDSLTYGGRKFYCDNGVMLLDEANKVVKLLGAGSYLDFYVEKDGIYTLATEDKFECLMEMVPNANSKAWRIKAIRSALDVGEKLVLGIIVSNNEYKFIKDDLFKCIEVKVNPVDLQFKIENKDLNLDVVLGDEDAKHIVPFNEIVKVEGGSYDSCVLAVAETDLENCMFELSGLNLTFDGTKYYVVGNYLDGNFRNRVTALFNDVNDVNTKNSLYLVQLKTGYDKVNNEKFTVEDMLNINNIAGDDISSLINNVYKANEFIINVKQTLKIDKAFTTSEIGKIYENSDNIVTIIGNENVDKLFSFYKLIDIDIADFVDKYLYLENAGNINITKFEKNADSDNYDILFTTFESVENSEKTKIGFKNFVAGEDNSVFAEFNILSSAPTDIVYYDAAGNKLYTLGRQQSSAPTHNIEIDWLSPAGFGFQGLGENQKLSDELKGFQDAEGFKVDHDIFYTTTDSEIIHIKDNEIKSFRPGEAYLIVTVKGVERYLKVVVTYNEKIEFEKVGLEGSKEYIDDGTSLRDLITFTYDGVSDLSNALKWCNISNFVFDQNYTSTEEEGLITVKTDKGIDILTITEQPDGDWVFNRSTDKYSALSFKFDVNCFVKTVTVIVEFNQDVSHYANASFWGTENKVYQNTEVLAVERILKRETNPLEFVNQSLVRVSNIEDITVAYCYTKSAYVEGFDYNSGLDKTELSAERVTKNIKFEELTTYTIYIFVKNGTDYIEICYYEFEVVPNVVVKQVKDGNNDTSLKLGIGGTAETVLGNTAGQIQVYNFKENIEEPTVGTFAYGQKFTDKDGKEQCYGYSTEGETKTLNRNDSLFTNLTAKTELYDEDYGWQDLKDDYNSLFVEKVSGVNTVSTGWLKELYTDRTVLVNVYSGSYLIGNFSVTLENNNNLKVNSSYTRTDYTKTNSIDLMFFENVSSIFEIDGFELQSVTIYKTGTDLSDPANVGITIYTKNTLISIPVINDYEYYSNCIVKFVFNNGSKELTYTSSNGLKIAYIDGDLKYAICALNILPFSLTTKTEIQAYSETEFNGLTGVYEIDGIDNIYSITLSSINDKETGETLVSGNFVNKPLIKADDDEDNNITFGAITKNQINAVASYTVKYSENGQDFEITQEFVLKNYQRITANYPESNIDDTSSLKYDNIAFITSGDNFTTNNNGFSSISGQFEVVTLSTQGMVINLLDSANSKLVQRIAIEDASGKGRSYSVVSLKKYAYELGFNDNYVKNRIVCDGTTITLPYEAGLNGFVIFRLTTNSGAYVDYTFKITTGKDIQNTNNEYSATITKDEITSGGELLSSVVENDLTNLINDNNETKDFTNAFGGGTQAFNTNFISLYLLESKKLTTTGYSEFYYEGCLEIEEDAGEPATKFSKVNSAILHQVDSVVTLTLSVVYKNPSNANDVQNLGVLTIYILPDNITPSFKVDLTNGQTNQDAVSNSQIIPGEYKVEIDKNTTKIINPFSGYTLNTISNDTYFNVSGNDISVTKKNTTSEDSEDVDCVAYYNNGDSVYKVTYIYERMTLATAQEVVVGQFIEADKDFNNKITFDSSNYNKFIGDYQGTVIVGSVEFAAVLDSTGNPKFSYVSGSTSEFTDGTNKIGTYAIVSDVLVLTFDQGNEDVTQNLPIVFVNADNQTITHRITVKSIVHLKGTSGSVLPSTIKATGLFADKIGSTVDITKTNEKEVTGEYKVISYSIGSALKFFVKIYNGSSDADLELYFEELLAIKDADGNSLKTEHLLDNYSDLNSTNSTKKPINSTSTMNFYHSPVQEGIEVDMEIKVKIGANELKFGTSNTFYLTVNVVNTYLELLPYYLTEESEHENVYKGTNLTTEQFINALSGIGGYEHEYRLLILPRNYAGGELDTHNLINLGFADPENLNCLRFVGGTNASISDGNSKITFSSSITKNIISNVSINNALGAEFNYKFQIVTTEHLDKLDFTVANGNSSHYVEHPTDPIQSYISFVLGSKLQDYGSLTFNLATILDGENKFLTIDDEVSGGDYRLSSTIANDSKTFEKAHNNYTVIRNGSDLRIRVEFNSLMPVGTNSETITLDFYGTNGIETQIKLIFFKDEIGLKSSSVDTVVSGASFNLYDKFNDVTGMSLNVDLTKSYDITNLTVEDIEAGETGKVLSTNATKTDTTLLGVYTDDTTQSLTDVTLIKTKATGQTVKIKLFVTIYVEGYIVNDVYYIFEMTTGMQFANNGDNLSSTQIGTTSFETNFIMTTDANGASTYVGNFPITYYFNNGDLKNVSKQTYITKDYYAELYYRVYSLANNTANSFDVTIRIAENAKNQFTGICSVDNNKLVFEKDYTGKLPLEVIITPTNGYKYIVNWTLNVTGILNTYISKNADDPIKGIIKNNSQPFDINKQIKVVNSTDFTSGDVTSGLIAEKSSIFDSTLTNIGDVNAQIKYATMLNSDAGKYTSNEARFNAVGSYTEAYSGNIYNGNEVSYSGVTLPIVPQGADYVTVYEITIQYMSLSKTYYVAYLVANNLSLTINKYEDNTTTVLGSVVDVNTRLMDENLDNNQETLGRTYLDLFYYAEIITKGGTDYTITYKGDGYYLNNNPDKLHYIQDVEGGYNIQVNEGDTPEYYIRSKSITNYQDTPASGDPFSGKMSMFNLSVNSIIEFKNFIDMLYGDLATPTDYNFVLSSATGRDSNTFETKIVHLSDGHWGVNLDGIDFVAECVADLRIIGTNGDIYQLSKYHSTQNETGFILYTNNKLVPTGAKKLNELFLNPPSEYAEELVVGIYGAGGTYTSPQGEWVSQAGKGKLTSDPSSEDPTFTSQTISVKTGVDTTMNYVLKKYMYSGSDGMSGIYSLTQSFFVIDASATNGAIYKAIYNTNVFTNGSDGESSTVNLLGDSGKITKFYSDGNGVIVEDRTTPTLTAETKLVGGNANAFEDSGVISGTNGEVISVNHNLLACYKQQQTNEELLILEFVAEVDGFDLYLAMAYSLPEIQTITAEFDMNASSDLVISLNQFYINNGGKYESFTVSNDLTYEFGTLLNKNGVACQYDNTVNVQIDGEAIKNYFISSNVTTITISGNKITYPTDKEIQFNIVINKKVS